MITVIFFVNEYYFYYIKLYADEKTAENTDLQHLDFLVRHLDLPFLIYWALFALILIHGIPV